MEVKSLLNVYRIPYQADDGRNRGVRHLSKKCFEKDICVLKSFLEALKHP